MRDWNFDVESKEDLDLTIRTEILALENIGLDAIVGIIGAIAEQERVHLGAYKGRHGPRSCCRQAHWPATEVVRCCKDSWTP